MGHYSEQYEASAREEAKREKKRARQQLTAMAEFRDQLIGNIGADGISPRHLDAFQDMMNETKLRAR